MMTTDHWPLFGLRLTTGRLELRLPSPDDLSALADLAVAGVHDPAVQPFSAAWTDVEPAARGRNVGQHFWGTLAGWRPQEWTLQLVVIADGQVVGTQGIDARNFGVLREVGTGSWLGAAYQGHGIGTEMRAAVLHLAFAGLGAEHAVSMAFTDNAASLAVSHKLGYVDDGIERQAVRGRAVTGRRLRLDRSRWAAHRTFDVQVHGLAPCLPLFDASSGEIHDEPHS